MYAWGQKSGAFHGLLKIGAGADRAKEWIGVDMDGTLAEYKGYKGPDIIGAPIPAMVKRVKAWLDRGEKVKIFTARANMPKAVTAIKAWCKEHLGRELPVTNVKDHRMRELWDDRAHRVEKNTGVKLASAGHGKNSKKSLGWAYVRLPKPVRDAMKQLRDKIDPADLNEDGKEGHPHITVMYGFTESDPEVVRKAVATNGGGSVRMGKTTLFRNDERDVLKVTVTGRALHALHKSLDGVDNENKFKTFVPHATLAYLKPGTGDKYKNLDLADGLTFDFTGFVFEDADDNATDIGLGAVKQAQAAPGIEDMAVYGDVLGTLKPGDITDWVLQRHDTIRNPKNPHYDLRLGTKDTNLFSWAVPGAVMPGPGEFKRPLPQTQLHTYQYGSFEGKIPRGYGAGTVKMQDKGKAIITKVTPNTLHFTLGHTRIPTRYVLIHTGGRDGRMWQLYAKPEPGKIPGVGQKPIYKAIEAADQDEAVAQALQLQEKIDGAHGIVDVNDRGDVDVYSVRPSTTGKPVSHTERMQIFGAKAPGLRNTTMRGELYYADAGGRAIPFKDVSGLLNMVPARSLERQRELGLAPRVAVFDVLRHGGADTAAMTVAERRLLARRILRQLPSPTFHQPAAAAGTSEKMKLLQTIREGRNPRTSEGVMAVMPDQSIRKIKNRQEATGYLTGLYEGTGRRAGSAGGLTFVTDKDKPVEGRVGTGFTDAELKDIVTRIRELKGQPIRLEHQGVFGSGKLRAPSFKGFETDKAAEAMMHKPALIKMAQMGRWLSTGLDRLANYGTYQTAQALPELVHETGLGHAQAVADLGFATADATAAGAGLAHIAARNRVVPGVTNTFRGLRNVAGRLAVPMWAAGYAVDGVRGIADPRGRAAAAKSMLMDYDRSRGIFRGIVHPVLNNASYGFAAPASSALALGESSSELGAATRDMMAARSSSKRTAAAVAARQQQAANARRAPATPVTGVRSNLPPARVTQPLAKTGSADTVTLQFSGRDGTVKAAAAVEIADTPDLRQRGLGFRHTLSGDRGMFFDKVGSYWMKHVPFPLDIVFVDKAGSVLQKQAMAVEADPSRPSRIYRGPAKAAHAIELPGGWCDRHGIGPGDTVALAQGQVKAAAGLNARSIMNTLKGVRKPLWGRGVANQVRAHGATIVGHNADEPFARHANQVLRRLGLKDRIDLERAQGVRRLASPGVDARGVRLNLGGSPQTQHTPARMKTVGRITPKIDALGRDKLLEARVFGRSEPKTVDMAQVLRAVPAGPGYRSRLMRELQRRLGPRYILKPRFDSAASKGGFLTDQGIGSGKSISRRLFKNYVGQTRLALAPTTGAERFVDQLVNAVAMQPRNLGLLERVRRTAAAVPQAWRTRGQVGKVTVPKGFSIATKGTQEFRVHALDGKVIPYATIGRGSTLSMFNPLYTRTHRAAEAEVQRALNRLPHKYRQGSYGFDVAKLQDGSVRIIEANPAGAFGASGFLTDGRVIDATLAAAKGRLPAAEWVRRGTLGAGGLGVVNMAAGNSQPPEPTWQQRLASRTGRLLS